MIKCLVTESGKVIPTRMITAVQGINEVQDVHGTWHATRYKRDELFALLGWPYDNQTNGSAFPRGVVYIQPNYPPTCQTVATFVNPRKLLKEHLETLPAASGLKGVSVKSLTDVQVGELLSVIMGVSRSYRPTIEGLRSMVKNLSANLVPSLSLPDGPYQELFDWYVALLSIDKLRGWGVAIGPLVAAVDLSVHAVLSARLKSLPSASRVTEIDTSKLKQHTLLKCLDILRENVGEDTEYLARQVFRMHMLPYAAHLPFKLDVTGCERAWFRSLQILRATFDEDCNHPALKGRDVVISKILAWFEHAGLERMAPKMAFTDLGPLQEALAVTRENMPPASLRSLYEQAKGLSDYSTDHAYISDCFENRRSAELCQVVRALRIRNIVESKSLHSELGVLLRTLPSASKVEDLDVDSLPIDVAKRCLDAIKANHAAPETTIASYVASMLKNPYAAHLPKDCHLKEGSPSGWLRALNVLAITFKAGLRNHPAKTWLDLSDELSRWFSGRIFKANWSGASTETLQRCVEIIRESSNYATIAELYRKALRNDEHHEHKQYLDELYRKRDVPGLHNALKAQRVVKILEES